MGLAEAEQISETFVVTDVTRREGVAVTVNGCPAPDAS